ncbi:MAG: preprotein translocase subunit SecG [Firmicutes bacterium]|nr:preprotein translocase subunit SecG [Bacillota bacterium]MDY5676808.1 preprotein translocase subunit SecG [Eubacteriales bacterium]
MNFRYLLDVSAEVAKTLTTIRSILLILTAIASIVIIVAVLIQPSNPDGGRNVITGTNDSYYAQNKGDTKEGRLKKIIIISSVVILVLTVAFYVIEHFFAG